jgi:WD40 repeat protein
VRRRQAICIGINTFHPNFEEPTQSPLDAESILLSSQAWPELPFAAERSRDLASALEACGYRCELPPQDLSATELGTIVREAITADSESDLRIIHVLSHGTRTDHTGKLYVVGADGRHHSLTDVESWLSTVEDFGGAMTLFLLDLCHSGTAARYSWQLANSDGSARAWVIAGAAPNEVALNGRFTLAAAQTIRALHDGELDVHRSYQYVPLGTIAQEIKRRVISLAEEARGLSQSVTASSVDLTADVTSQPFFTNPQYDQTEWDSLRLGLDPTLAAFLDDLDPESLLDPSHFLDRAAGRGPLRSRVHVGCFTGRQEQLGTLTAWCEHALRAPGVCVVTGSPGTGKSALLGVMVCAMHPRIRDGSRVVWERAVGDVHQNDWLAAAHARQQPVAQMIESFREQLRLPADSSSPESFCEAVAELPEQPLIVIDALDEAAHPLELMNTLLLPLITTLRADRMPACRLVVGMRPWDDLRPLYDAAAASGSLIDLDSVSPDIVRADLAEYVERLTANCLPYKDQSFSPIRSAFGMALARTLAGQTPPSGQRWGEFLVAGLYTHHVIDRLAPVRSEEEATAIGVEVPRTLPGVLNLDLRAQPPNPLLLPVLGALAFARGNGMPTEVIRRMASAFLTPQEEGSRIETRQIQETLKIIRFYLRTAPDSDASTLYRLFHQGLADHLRAHPLSSDRPADPDLPSDILDRLLGPLPRTPSGGIVGWAAARPYTLRHAIQHAAEASRADELLVEPEFLVHADSGRLFPELDHAQGESARISAIVYRTSAHLHRSASTRDRQQLLAIDAARCHVPNFSRRLSDVPASPVQLWRPVAAFAGDTDIIPKTTDAAITEDVYAVGCATVGGRQIIVSGHGDAALRMWDVHTGVQIGKDLRAHRDAVRCLTCTDLDGRPIAVSGGADHDAIIWDLSTGLPLGDPLTGHSDWIRGVACTILQGRVVAVTASADNTVRIWDLESGKPVGGPMRGHSDWVRSVSCGRLGDLPVAVTASADGSARVWDLGSRHPLGEPIKGHVGAVRAVVYFQLHGLPVLATGGADGTVRLWDLDTHEPIGHPLAGHPGGVWALTSGSVNGVPVIVAGSTDGSLRTWDLSTLRQLRPATTAHGSWVSDLAYVEGAGRDLISSSSGDGTVRLWDAASGEPVLPPMSLHTATVDAIACGHGSTRSVIRLAATDGRVRTVDPQDGRQASPMIQLPQSNAISLATLVIQGRDVLATGSCDGDVRAWDMESGTPADLPAIPRQDGLTALASAAGSLLITGTGDGDVRAWDMESGTPADLPAISRQDGLAALAANDWQVLAVASGNTLTVWDLPNARSLETITLPVAIRALAITSANYIAVSLGWEIILFQPTRR